MYTNIHVVSEDSVNRVEILPNPVAVEPELVIIESEDSGYLDYMSIFDGMLEEEVDVMSFDQVPPTENTVPQTEEQVPPAEGIDTGEFMKTMFMSVIDRNVLYCKEVKELKEELQAVREDKTSMEGMWEEEHDDRVLAMDKVRDLRGEVFELKQELKTNKRKLERMSYIHRSSHVDFQRQVAGYQVEAGQTRHTISRDVIAGLARADFENALR